MELATKLGDRYGAKRRRNPAVELTLIDMVHSHVWKPKLHEIAAGSMDIGLHEVAYSAQAHWHGFRFCIGQMAGLDRRKREVLVGPYVDEDGIAVAPPRRIGYDTLVIAIGSQSNEFGTPGVSEHALKLETTADARAFHRRMIHACIRANTQTKPLSSDQLNVAIIGAGATGVELAAELHRATRELIMYGLDRIDPDKDLRIELIEAAGRILPGLPERLSTAAQELLEARGVKVHLNAKVAQVMPRVVRLADGRELPAELIVWAAGVKAAELLSALDGLQTNRINQLLVRPSLQTTLDDDVFAIGDCAACPWPEATEPAPSADQSISADAAARRQRFVPPRAQAAHQQASHMVKQIARRFAGQPLKPYHYRDFGSLVSFGKYSTVGNMMGGLIGGTMMVEGLIARMMYLSLYKMHELALHGWPKVALDTLARGITRRTEPHVKLH